MAKNVKRLYEHFQPENYKLAFDISDDNLSFSGKVVIRGKKSGRPSQRLTFHQKELNIKSATITRHDKGGDMSISVVRINHHNTYDEVRLHSDDMIYPGKYTITLEFNSSITRPMSGIYPSFFNRNDKKHTIITTQFESHHAREAFPCIDEPEAKATFDLTLTTPVNKAVLSNTPIKSQKTAAKRLTTVFESTPIMSTYLLAFVAGDLKFLEAKTKNDIVVRTYATPDNIQHTDFALDVAVKCLEFYQDYFGIDFPLAKCDFIALPDFAAGAMENWGCITFREQALLVDPDHTSMASKQYVASVVAHELTHQWFGNLVTMRWWTDLWLNEGFATWMSYLAIDHIYPEWEMWTQFIVDEQQQAMKLDALENTHPIEVPVRHPDEIRTIFDSISYDKGASVIHMLYKYLGPDTFQKGIQYYLAQNSYGNTDTADLWEAFGKVAHRPVKEFMHDWVTKAGFPLLSANFEDDKLILSQQQFFINPNHSDLPRVNWPIPLNSDNEELPEIFRTDRAEFSLGEDDFVKLNREHGGFFRTVYNTSHLEKLGSQIKRGHLSPLDRLGILSDLAETSRAGMSDTADTLKFLSQFSDEDNYAVWDVIAAFIGQLKMVMNDESLREEMKPYIRKLVSKQVKELGWNRKPNEKHFDRLLRPIILGMAAAADNPTIVKKCREVFDKTKNADDLNADYENAPFKRSVKRGGEFDPDLRGVVFGTIARKGAEDDYQHMLKMYEKSTSSEEKVALAAALTGFKQEGLIANSLSMITTDKVRLQDAAYWVAYSFANRYGRLQSWEWLKNNWTWLKSNLGSDIAFTYLPIYAARPFSDKSFIKEYKKFFNSVMEPALERSFKQGLELIELQSAWRDRSLKEVKTFFKNA